MNLCRNKPSSLRKQGSRRTHVFSHLDPRVREDDGEKLLEQIRKRGFRRITSNCKSTVLVKIAVVECVELVQLLDPCLRREDGGMLGRRWDAGMTVRCWDEVSGRKNSILLGQSRSREGLGFGIT